MRRSPNLGFAARWALLAVVAWALPFLLYWFHPPAPPGPLHREQGPWRDADAGRFFQSCYVALIVIAPSVLARGAFLSVRWRSSRPMLIALGLAVFAIVLLWHQMSALFWLID